MDDRSYEILSDIQLKYARLIRLQDFEDEELLDAKQNRPFGEYCWTCTSSLIFYVLSHFKEDMCTYVDADTYFYQSPQILINEMLYAKKSVMVVPHGFPKKDEHRAEKVGRYCVEFNTFVNNVEGITVLREWRRKCLECCCNLGDGIHWGDQKYLDEWPSKYNFVYICQNQGAGLASWNIENYEINSSNQLILRETGAEINIVFYHFHGIEYYSKHVVKPGIMRIKGKYGKHLETLYIDYLLKINQKKDFLNKKYRFAKILYKHPLDKRGSRLKMIIKRTWIGNIIWIRKAQNRGEYLIHF